MKELLKNSSLPEFFKEKVTDATHTLHVKVSEEVEFYIVQLLTHFSKTQHLYHQAPDGKNEDKPLAIQFFEAQMASQNSKIPILKKMGDVSLYFCGFFAESFFRKIVNADYYMKMGETAYSSLAHIVDTSANLKNIFGELSHNFSKLVDVLTEVANTSQMANDQNLLKLYDRWLKTGSERTKHVLIQSGILINDTIKTNLQQ